MANEIILNVKIWHSKGDLLLKLPKELEPMLQNRKTVRIKLILEESESNK